MFTIVRNQFHTNFRKRRREVEDADGAFAEKLAIAPEQGGHMDFADLQAALTQLSPDQREAILLVGAEGLTYEETAAICGSKVGTIKSRVNRARKRLAELLGYVVEAEHVGPSPTILAVITDHGAALPPQ